MNSRFDDVVARLERGNHVLFSKTSPCLERLSQMLGEVDQSGSSRINQKMLSIKSARRVIGSKENTEL